MKTNRMVSLMIIFSLFFSLAIGMKDVSAYGWGYKKSTDNKPPDAGKYGEILKEHRAIYREETDEKIVYLTFDNGYEEGYTGDILDVLLQQRVPATFFVTGHYVDSEPGLVQRMVNEGHIIGNHSDSHPDFTTMSDKEIKEELNDLQEAVTSITNQKEMNYLRPPKGTFNEKTIQLANKLGYTHVFWSLAFKDWETDKQQGWRYAYNNVMEQIHPGAVILLHTVSEDNAKALKHIITDLKKEGYTFKSLDELMIKKELPEGVYELFFH